MNRRPLNSKNWKLFTLAAVCWMAMSGFAFAQADKKEEADPPQYVEPYAVVLLGIGLGMLVVLRTSRRRERARPEQFDTSSLGTSIPGAAPLEKTRKIAPRQAKELCKDAQTAMYMAIAGVLPIVGIFPGLLGLWKGIQAKKMIASNPRLTGDGMALAGIIVGAIAAVVQLIVTLLLLMRSMF